MFVIFILTSFNALAQNQTSSCKATFKFYNGVGEFIIGEGATAISLGSASAGYAFTNNDESFTTLKDFGAIPTGKYKIRVYSGSKFKNVPNVFDITPMQGTNTYGRNDFKIHGRGTTEEKKAKTAAESSNGCIILEPNQRLKLKQYFDQCGGEIILTVTNK